MNMRIWIRRALARLRAGFSDEPASPDPIDHPEIRRMNLAQLADLPFEPYPRGGENLRGLCETRPAAGRDHFGGL